MSPGRDRRLQPTWTSLLPRLINRPDRSAPIRSNHTVPYGTVPFLHGYQAIPRPRRGRGMPGYDHLVPPGQSPTSPSSSLTRQIGQTAPAAIQTRNSPPTALKDNLFQVTLVTTVAWQNQ
jgi:hypothetical protein